MTEGWPYTVDWAEHLPRLAAGVMADADRNATVARDLVRPSDRLAIDLGCGAGGTAPWPGCSAAAACGCRRDLGMLAAARDLSARGPAPGCVAVDFIDLDLDTDVRAARRPRLAGRPGVGAANARLSTALLH
jgi:hypothetical protein